MTKPFYQCHQRHLLSLPHTYQYVALALLDCPPLPLLLDRWEYSPHVVERCVLFQLIIIRDVDSLKIYQTHQVDWRWAMPC